MVSGMDVATKCPSDLKIKVAYTLDPEPPTERRNHRRTEEEWKFLCVIQAGGRSRDSLCSVQRCLDAGVVIKLWLCLILMHL